MTTFADPIQTSIARVVPKTAQRLGYRLCAVCRHCHGALNVRVGSDLWTHRRTGGVQCR